ncbi:hypothetical protein TIFTF001_029538 [Ficus carica]|uniref:Uncharacterized protein n=1 Tax=Ficus carica TaxID=3494 RepID=A0AA88J3I0_FICCA|nr:hypothetical protein TIFTF001_029538 [Ficus carica]
MLLAARQGGAWGHSRQHGGLYMAGWWRDSPRVVRGGVCMDIGRNGAREGIELRAVGGRRDSLVAVARRGLRLRVTLN